jgi:DNA-binding MarR family transcriptional regulator
MRVYLSRKRSQAEPGSCAASLVHLGSLISAQLDRGLRGRGLSGAAFNVLRVLSESDGAACPYEISERLSVSRATITGLLDSLESSRLVRRVPHPVDRRMLRVEMTERARRLMVDLRPEQERALRRMFAGIPAREQRRLVSLLGRLQTHLRQGPRSPGQGRAR